MVSEQNGMIFKFGELIKTPKEGVPSEDDIR